MDGTWASGLSEALRGGSQAAVRNCVLVVRVGGVAGAEGSRGQEGMVEAWMERGALLGKLASVLGVAWFPCTP